VASNAAVGGYATSRHFHSTVFGQTKNAGRLCHSREAAFDDTSDRAIAAFAFWQSLVASPRKKSEIPASM
jgi:hypothetical protein